MTEEPVGFSVAEQEELGIRECALCRRWRSLLDLERVTTDASAPAAEAALLAAPSARRRGNTWYRCWDEPCRTAHAHLWRE